MLCVLIRALFFAFFFFNSPATTEIYTLSLHDALPICPVGNVVELERSVGLCGDRLRDRARGRRVQARVQLRRWTEGRSEEHTSELQSHSDLVCRLLLEKKKKYDKTTHTQDIQRVTARR